MEDKKKDILEGLKVAMEAELTGHAFYENAAQSTTDPKGKETFSQMAREELRHFQSLRHQYQAVLEHGAYDPSVKLDKQTLSHAKNPVFSEALKNRIKDAHFEVSALTIGMKLELDAMNYYRSCAEKARQEEAKLFFTQLAQWEEDHYRAFQNQLDMLKEDYFQANNFVPM